MILRLAPIALVVGLAAPAAFASPAAPGRALLPSALGPTAIQAVSGRVVVRPDGAGGFRADLTLTVLNPGDSATEVELLFVAGEGLAWTMQAALGGDPLLLEPTDQGSVARARLEAGEVTVLQSSVGVQAELLAAVPASEAGWLGAVRGPVLQPFRRLEVSRGPGSPLAGGPLEVEIALDTRVPASAVFVSAGGRLADGVATWSRSVAEAGTPAVVTWAAAPNETLVPEDADEAAAFLEYWSHDRRLATADLSRVRSALDGSTRSSEDWWIDGSASTATVAEMAAATALRTAETSSGTAVSARAPARALPAAATSASPTAAPSLGSGQAASSRQAAPAPRGQAVAARAAGDPRGDADLLVTVPPDGSWREENLLRSPASVPRTTRAASRWVARALREAHGTSRAVLARESVLALHGKTWAPGYVADFFGRQAWYHPDPAFDPSTLEAEETGAHAVLNEMVQALAITTRTATPVAVADLSDSSPAGRETELEPAPASRSARAAESVTEAVAGSRQLGEEAVASRTDEFMPEGEHEPPAGSPGEPRADMSSVEQAEARSPAPPETPAPRAVSTAPAASEPTGEAGPVPWIRSAPAARIFLAGEKARGPLQRRRVEEAAATIEARCGRPFDDEPRWRARFEAEPWFTPRPDYHVRLLGPGALEALTLLRGSLGEAGGAIAVAERKQQAGDDSGLQFGQAASSSGSSQSTGPAGTPDDDGPGRPALEAVAVVPDPVPGPAVPWLRSAVDARLFLASEEAGAPADARRLEAAIALVEARSGNPFFDRPGLRARYAGEAWYQPVADWSPERLAVGGREAITLLRRRLRQ